MYVVVMHPEEAGFNMTVFGPFDSKQDAEDMIVGCGLELDDPQPIAFVQQVEVPVWG